MYPETEVWTPFFPKKNGSSIRHPVPSNRRTALEALLFAEGVLTVEDTVSTTFKAELSFGPGSVMELTGVVTPAQHGHPPHAHITGVGKPGSPLADYFYDYDGSLTEHWPNGVKQVAAITGSVIRVKPHNGEPAGLVASFLAVKA